MAMFGNNRLRDEAEAPPIPREGHPAGNAGAKRGMFSVIGPDVTLTGNVIATADIHIDGRIEGDVHCGALVQGPESRIAGTVNAEEARLAGAIEGTVRVTRLTVERTARITGDVEYETIAIENGAHIDGRLKHAVAKPRSVEEPVRLVSGGEADAA